MYTILKDEKKVFMYLVKFIVPNLIFELELELLSVSDGPTNGQSDL